MAVYLHDVPLSEAKNRFQKALEDAGMWGVLETEEIPLDENAVGRTLAAPVWAKISSPHYHASAMDGFALRAESTVDAMPSSPVSLQIGLEAAYVDTGDPLPDWADAVVPIENVEPLGVAGLVAADARHPFAIRLRAGLTPWSHVRPLGEDIVATQLVLPAGQVLRPFDLGAVAASGHSTVNVSRKPRVAILPTGTELVPVGSPVKRGDIIEYNSIMLAAQVKSWGGDPVRFPISPDDLVLIRRHVQEAADLSDLVLLNAGSSAGSEDFSARVVEELGELLVHGVAVRPGHPVILGMVRRSEISGSPGKMIPIIGIPGYPVSAALTGEIFVEPLLAKWIGRNPVEMAEIDAVITRKINSPAGDDDYVRMVVGKVGDRMLAAPLARGAGVITSLVRAAGIAILPRGIQGLEAGSKVRVRLYGSPQDLERTLLVIGSHDMTLDLLAQFLSDKGVRIMSANVGSLGGLVALRRGEAHFAGSHLLDPETGEYNFSFIRQYLPGVPIRLMSWVNRQQGLMVQAGNPKGLHSLKDLARKDIVYVNRQRGAGTRILLDFHLEQLQIAPESISGYNQEEYTHLAVAAAVSSGRADCGLGIAAAASALNLDFIPLYQERYDLVIPRTIWDHPLMQPLIALTTDPTFRETVAAMPGYDVSPMGNIVGDME